MAELNDKLISYGNLSTFYDKLQEQGLGGNAIEDVSVLPDASANKNKLVRLASDKKVYVSECTSEGNPGLGFAAIKDSRYRIIFRRYSDGDNTNDVEGYKNYQICWCAVYNSQGLYFDDVRNWNKLTSYYIFTESENVSIGTYCYNFETREDDEIKDYTPNVDYEPATWAWKQLDDSIVDIQTLPDAEENKNKIVRLSNDKKVYVSECIFEGSEGNPGFAAIQLYYGEDGGTFIYKRYQELDNKNEGNYYTTDNQIAWVQIDNSYNLNFNEITDWNSYSLYIVLYTPSTVVSIGDIYKNIDSGTNDKVTNYNPNIGYEPAIPAIWAWKPVVTEDELYPNESTFTGATLTVDGSQPSIVASGSTTIVWDDLASSIPSGKSVEVSIVLINTGNSALTPTMQGNYQMMGDGNLTIQAGELGLYRGRYISALNKWLIEAIYQKVSGVME